MALSTKKPQIEPPPEELSIAPANAETLEECLDEMELCDHAMDTLPEEQKYEVPSSLTYAALDIYSALRETSTALLTQIWASMMEGYYFEFLKSCFKKPEPVRDPLKAPEGGDESGKITYAFLQKMKNYLSIHELKELFHWNGVSESMRKIYAPK